MRIEVKELCFSAGSKRILNGVSAVFEGKKIHGIIGPNGCGKTTLLRHIYRQYPAKGHVWVDDQPIEAYSSRDYARRVAVMMQTYPEADLRVCEVVRSGRYPYKKVMMPYGREDEAVTGQVLRQTRLWELRDRRIHTLSGGERQRVMIARCLVQQPEVIILDEPTNHLDIRYRVELMEMLRAFDGMVIITLHDLNLAARYCDCIHVMKDGALLASGAPGDVLCAEILNEAFDTTIRTVEHGGRLIIGV
ncbi:MAG: ABC transporter ATP-binding protein [Clostridia bacterium]|nr:ABC transporter ATP-binding protein [Clostridia bacterium]